MGVDLMGHGGASFTWHQWRGCFRLAVAFGWQPAGTVAPAEHSSCCDEEWSGTYFTNDYQEVTADDAHALAAALRRALTALRTGENLAGEQAKALAEISGEGMFDLAEHVALRTGRNLTPAEHVVLTIGRDWDTVCMTANLTEGMVCKLADYAERGGFLIG